MPTRYVPMSEDEQKFAALVERVFSDPAFAKAMQTDPAKALAGAGYQLTAAQTAQLKSPKPAEIPGLDLEQLAAAPAASLIRPVVNIITKGTKPVVRVITKGTAPAVNVVTNTTVAVEESRAHPLQELPEESNPPRQS